MIRQTWNKKLIEAYLWNIVTEFLNLKFLV